MVDRGSRLRGNDGEGWNDDAGQVGMGQVGMACGVVMFESFASKPRRTFLLCNSPRIRHSREGGNLC